MGLTGLGFVMSRRRKVDSTDANNDLTVPSSADAWSAQGTLGFAARPLIANA
jgi:hypothetical protein